MIDEKLTFLPLVYLSLLSSVVRVVVMPHSRRVRSNVNERPGGGAHVLRIGNASTDR